MTERRSSGNRSGAVYSKQQTEIPFALPANVRMFDAASRIDGRNGNGAIAAHDATSGQRKQITSFNFSKMNRSSNKSDTNMAMEYTWVPEAGDEEEMDASQPSKKGGVRV